MSLYSEQRSTRHRRGPPIRNKASRRPDGTDGLFWLSLSIAWTGTAIISFMCVIFYENVAWFMTSWTIQTVLVGGGASLALYIFNLPEDRRINLRTATLRLFTGSVFGFVAAKLAAGVGMNESLQAAVSGAGGAKGPHYIDTILQRALGQNNNNNHAEHHDNEKGETA